MTVYRAPPAGAVRLEPLDDFTLAYHLPAGVTHLLAEPAPEILAALGAGPADTETLLARLAERYALDDDARAGIAERLDELVAAGLVATA